MNLYHTAIELLRIFALVVGILIIFAGVARGAVEARGAGGRDRAARRITEGAALGLEFFIGATILNLILNPTWPAVATTALTILVRQLLTLSLGASSPARRAG
ncbi:MAG: DUF1622 domain-containing protein [Actinomycetota bacterium]|jgi:uncharacterized membrane protein|nr:DUF1622 domain-containing protein [Actinomycetota bacterium]